MAGADPFAIMKAMGHADIKMTMICVSLGKSHIREQVERFKRHADPKKRLHSFPRFHTIITRRRFPHSVATFRFPLQNKPLDQNGTKLPIFTKKGTLAECRNPFKY